MPAKLDKAATAMVNLKALTLVVTSLTNVHYRAAINYRANFGNSKI